MQYDLRQRSSVSLPPRTNTVHLIASCFGILAGFGNLGYGIIEILQGNSIPAGIIVNALTVPFTRAAHVVEPTIVLIPNFIITGSIVAATSIIYIILSAAFIKRKNAGIIMIALSIFQVIVGGSFARSIQSLIYGLVGTRINSNHKWWRLHLSIKSRQFMSQIWLEVFVACLVLYMIHISMGFVAFFISINQNTVVSILVAVSSYGNLLFFVLTLIAGFASDSLRYSDRVEKNAP